MKAARLVFAASLFCLAGCPDDEPIPADNNSNNVNNTNNSNNTTNSNNSNSSNNTTNSNNSNNTTNTNNSNNTTNTNNSNNTTNTNNSNNTTNTNNSNGCMNPTGGDWTVDVQISPNEASVGDQIEASFTLNNFTFCDDIGGDNSTNTGHYGVYLTQVDDDHLLLRSFENPADVTLDLANAEIQPGQTNMIVVIYQNDMTNYTPPVEISIPFTVVQND